MTYLRRYVNDGLIGGHGKALIMWNERTAEYMERDMGEIECYKQELYGRMNGRLLPGHTF